MRGYGLARPGPARLQLTGRVTWSAWLPSSACRLSSDLAISSISICPKGPLSWCRRGRRQAADPAVAGGEPVRLRCGVTRSGVTNPSGSTRSRLGKFAPYTLPGSRNSFPVSEYSPLSSGFCPAPRGTSRPASSLMASSIVPDSSRMFCSSS